ncbi:MAG: DNA-binding response regulator [Anaerolineaceae bacterium]|jgi:DNA-binding response OmpR family regulator|nr:MAG: DNA-binding response regulator [Anaerolineaceae bacterium]
MKSSKPVILIVEGKRSDRSSFSGGLIKKDYEVRSVPNGNEAVDFVKHEQPQVVIVDASSLRTAGKRICSAVRKETSDTPIILIVDEDIDTAKLKDVNEILVFPFTLQKLLNRIKPFLQRDNNNVLEVDPIKLDLSQRWVYCNGKNERLTPRLFILMKTLMQKPGKLITREDLFKTLWETEYVGDMRSLDVHISWLRKAIEEDPRNPNYIKTKRGVGYYLDLPEQSPKTKKEVD